MATALWPNASEAHAFGNLRSTLARLDPTSRSAVEVDRVQLRLADNVDVDLSHVRARAHRLLDPLAQLSEDDLSVATISGLSSDLLCGWYDDWVILEAEAWRQVRLQALDALVGHLRARRRFGLATVAAGVAIRAEPLRESARAALIRVHLAQGNQSEARREFELYRVLLRNELNLEPTRELSELVRK